MHIIKKRWSKVKVSLGTNRRIRPLSCHKIWKAHEWRTWLLVWLPVFKGKVPPGLYKLLSKFTLGILLLLKNNVTREEVENARTLLHSFCKGNEWHSRVILHF